MKKSKSKSRSFLAALATVSLAALPLAAAAQGPGPGGPPAGGPGQNGRWNPQQRVERVEKRMKLARTLGLAEALDLDAPQALKLGDALSRFDDRRMAAHRQLAESRDVLRRAARGDKVAPAEVDQAIARAFDARAQLEAIDKETVAVVTKDLSPEKRARAVLFLARFQQRMRGMGGGMGPGMGRGMGPGMMGPGRGRGRGMGPGMGPGMGMGPGPGMGPRMMADGTCPNGDCPWMDEGGADDDD